MHEDRLDKGADFNRRSPIAVHSNQSTRRPLSSGTGLIDGKWTMLSPQALPEDVFSLDEVQPKIGARTPSSRLTAGGGGPARHQQFML